jgi:hypothetical protein
MTLGAQDKKKVGFLAVLALVGGYTLYTNVLSGPSGTTTEPPRRASAASAPTIPEAVALPAAPGAAPRAPASRSRGRSEEMHWVLFSKHPENLPDPATIDPTLKLDLLAKVQSVDLAGGSRNLFQFSTPPPPPKVEAPKGMGPKIALNPPAPAKPMNTAPVEPPPTPPPYKFYGFSTARNNGKKTAYFLDGDDILLVAEGDTLKRRYKVVRIGPTSVTMEDLDSKRQVSVPLVDESQS